VVPLPTWHGFVEAVANSCTTACVMSSWLHL